MMRGLFVVCTAVAALCVPCQARAVPVLWTLSGVTFDDGATASGSFVFDADTVVYSDIDITTTDGATLTGATYAFDHPGFPNNPALIIVAAALPLAAGVHAMNLSYSAPLTNAGGIVPLGTVFGAFGIEGLCATAGCFGVDPFRQPNAGELHGTVVEAPEPVTLLLLSPGLALIALRRSLRRV